MPSLDETVGIRIALACRAHRRESAAALEPLGLYVGQELILNELWKEEGITQSSLAERVGIDLSTMTKALQRMERAGFIERRADCDDNRTSRVHLTDFGRTLETGVCAAWASVEARALAGFNAEERMLLSALLARVAQNLH